MTAEFFTFSGYDLIQPTHRNVAAVDPKSRAQSPLGLGHSPSKEPFYFYQE